jgi:hypothetical protein
VSWISQYNEWNSFGLTNPNHQQQQLDDSTVDQDIYSEILKDPLLTLNRAECLLALFVHSIEIPELIRKNCTVPDQSAIDFLDDDRRQVLLREEL